MSEPRLTIGIPTFNRPERLQRAIASALWQSVPCRVLVADQGKSDECATACREYEEHPNFARVESPATTLWENWRFVAKEAASRGAEFFLWLQDDDLLAERVARRVVRSFYFFPGADLWCSSVNMAYDNMLGVKWSGNWGPKLPCDVLRGQPIDHSGDLLVPVGYFDSWAMAPAKAFRVGKAFHRMLDTLPDGCDCLTERLDIAAVGMGGRFIHDPVTAGYWIIHDRNESQITGATQPAQVAPAFAFLDGLMDRLPGWRQDLNEWIGCIGHPG